MSNISKVYRIAMPLTNQGSEDYDSFYHAFPTVGRQNPAGNWTWVHKHDELEWEICTHGNHLICLTEFSTREEAEEAEQSGYELLSEYGYFKEEED